MLKFQNAMRNKCKIKLGIQGPSGSGKTYSSLLIAYGLTNDWSKIAVIDTENGSANLYADLGPYKVLTLKAPYSPERYIECIKAAASEGFECLIIDSLSHEWSGPGGILEIHSNIPGNSFAAWAKVTPRHNAFMQELLQCDLHVIGTMRSKTDYVMSDKNGKTVPEKVGLKATQRDDAEYEFTLVFEMNHLQQAHVSKDRTGLFIHAHELKLSASTGELIKDWCSHGDTAQLPKEQSATDEFLESINNCTTIEALIELYRNNTENQIIYRDSFVARKHQLEKLKTYTSNGKHI